MEALEKARIPAGPVFSPRQALSDSQIRSGNFFTEMDYPGLPRRAPLVSPPIGLSRTPPQIRSRAPTAGEHTWQVLTEVGYAPEEIAGLKRACII
jgi:formyl-CoA transferase